MRGVLERCEEMARTNAGRGEATALEPETSGTSGSASRKSNAGLGFGHQATDQENQDPSTGRAPAWHAGIQVNPTNTPSAGTRHGGHMATGPMQAALMFAPIVLFSLKVVGVLTKAASALASPVSTYALVAA